MSPLIYVKVPSFPGGRLEPVEAELLHSSCFKILSTNPDADIGHDLWEFETGEHVTCEVVQFAENETGLVATKRCQCTSLSKSNS